MTASGRGDTWQAAFFVAVAIPALVAVAIPMTTLNWWPWRYRSPLRTGGPGDTYSFGIAAYRSQTMQRPFRGGARLMACDRCEIPISNQNPVYVIASTIVLHYSLSDRCWRK